MVGLWPQYVESLGDGDCAAYLSWNRKTKIPHCCNIMTCGCHYDRVTCSLQFDVYQVAGLVNVHKFTTDESNVRTLWDFNRSVTVTFCQCACHYDLEHLIHINLTWAASCFKQWSWGWRYIVTNAAFRWHNHNALWYNGTLWTMFGIS